MFESMDTNKNWKLKVSNYSPVLARKKVTFDDIEIDKKDTTNDIHNGSLSDDEVINKNSPSKSRKTGTIMLNCNNNRVANQEPRPRCLKSEKRCNSSEGVPKKKVRFAVPEESSDNNNKTDLNQDIRTVVVFFGF